MVERFEKEIEIGAKDVSTTGNVRVAEVEGKKEIVITLPSHPVKLWFDREAIDDFINKLKDLKKVI